MRDTRGPAEAARQKSAYAPKALRLGAVPLRSARKRPGLASERARRDSSSAYLPIAACAAPRS